MPADLELLVFMSVCRVTTRVEFWRVAPLTLRDDSVTM